MLPEKSNSFNLRLNNPKSSGNSFFFRSENKAIPKLSDFDSQWGFGSQEVDGRT